MDERWAQSPPRSNRLLRADDPHPVHVTNGGGSSPILLVGDHAGLAIPHSLARLGLPPAALDLHIASDIGVAGMGDRLAGALDACFIRQIYSRLVIDCNRQPGAPSSVPEISDDVAIPGNEGLGADDIAARQSEIYAPYQDAIAAELERRLRAGQTPLLVSLHSFTPVFQGHVRPWEMGVLHRNDSALSARVLELLQEELGDKAGDNEPYRMDEKDNTVPLHADARGLDYLELEVRQDLIADDAGQARAAALVGRVLVGALPDL